MLFVLPQLPYALDALEPHISGMTMDIHHNKLNLTYVNNLNDLISGTKYEDTELETIIKVTDGPIFNNASQVWNHSFYFEGMTPGDRSNLRGAFSKVLAGNFGSVQYFKEAFIRKAGALFGAGWIWLCWNPRGSLEIMPENNAGNPLRKGFTPLLACDVWEHSYYLDYHNRRTDYLDAFWNLVNWEIVEKRYNEAKKYNMVNLSFVSY